MARRRLFRKRTTWDVVKGNMHVVVTVAALFTMLYAWSGDPTPNHPAAFQAAADPVAAGTPAPESTSSLEELLPADAAPTPTPTAQTATPSAAQPPAVSAAQTEAPLTAPAAPVLRASQDAPPATLPIVPAVARQSLAEASPQVTPPVRAHADTTGIRAERQPAHGTRAHAARARVAQIARAKAPAATAKRKSDKRDVKVAERDPFSCAVRKKQPCF
jgi:hypothetical protein